MKAIEVETLPKFDSSGMVRHCFLYNSIGGDTPYYLVYECERDFTSVPPGYAVVRFRSLDIDRVDLNVGHQYPCFSYQPETGLCDQRGFFVIEGSAEVYQRDQTHFFMSMADSALEVICHQFELVTVVYHSDNPQDAFFNFVRENGSAVTG